MKKSVAVVFSLLFAAHVGAGVNIFDDSGGVYFSNDTLSLSLSKFTGHIYSVNLGGQELAGTNNGGYNQTVTQLGYYELGHSFFDTHDFSTRTGPGWVDAVITHTASPAMPFTMNQHHVLREGENGIHVFTEISHSSASPVSYLEQMNYIFLGDRNLFNTMSVTDARTSVMPRPEDVVIGAPNEVQNATFDLFGLGSPYPDRYYTKYDWSVHQKDAQVIGMTGGGYGAWMIQNNMESNNGGPLKQILTVHQTQTDPALIGAQTSIHYGSKRVDTNDNWSKTYGPKFLYFNTGADLAAMRADAKQYATPGINDAFYDSLGISGYTPSADRGRVTGRVNLPSNKTMAGAMVVLSDNNSDWQNMSRGYNYWAPAGGDGSFDLTGVRPGTYRVSVFKDGYFEEFRQDNVTVGTGSTLDIGNHNWNPPVNGTTIWQIGRPDRTAAEFKHGDKQYYWGAYDYNQDFPNGVNYEIGKSLPRDDWNYVQWRRWNNVVTSDWNVKFNLGNVSPGTVSLTIALASSQGPTDLTVFVNGTTGVRAITWTIPDADQQGSPAERSGNHGFYLYHTFNFNSNLLLAGLNNIGFHLTNQYNHQYDAIRLEIPGYSYAPGDFNGDNIVNVADLTLLARHWQSDGGLLQGDANGDWFVDLLDLRMVAQHWTNSADSPSLDVALASVDWGGPAPSVPEPGSLALLTLFGSALFRRRRTPGWSLKVLGTSTKIPETL